MFESSRAHHPRLMDDLKVDRTVITTHKLNDKLSDRQYWMSKTPGERFEALERLRHLAYGYDACTARLQRVLEIIKLDPTLNI